MPITTNDLDDGRGVIIVGRGTVTGEEFVDTLSRHLTQDKSKYQKYRYSLSDYISVTKVEIASQDIQRMTKLFNKAEIINPYLVVAIVVDRVIGYDLSRMWQLLRDVSNWDVMIFKSRDNAEAWIKKTVKEKFGITDLKLNADNDAGAQEKNTIAGGWLV